MMNELEKAAINHRDELNSYLWISAQDCTVENAKEAFIAGTQWKAKQSPWISVEERLPEEDGIRVWVKSSLLNYQPLTYHKGKFYARLLDGAYDGSVTHWMPIPQ